MHHIYFYQYKFPHYLKIKHSYENFHKTKWHKEYHPLAASLHYATSFLRKIYISKMAFFINVKWHNVDVQKAGPTCTPFYAMLNLKNNLCNF